MPCEMCSVGEVVLVLYDPGTSRRSEIERVQYCGFVRGRSI